MEENMPRKDKCICPVCRKRFNTPKALRNHLSRGARKKLPGYAESLEDLKSRPVNNRINRRPHTGTRNNFHWQIH